MNCHHVTIGTGPVYFNKKHIIRYYNIKVGKRRFIVTICHKERRNCSCKTTQMVTDSIFNRFFSTLTFSGFDSIYDLFAKSRYSFLKYCVDTFFENISSFLNKYIKAIIDLSSGLSCFVEICKSVLSFNFECFLFDKEITVFLCNNLISFLFKLFL